MESPNYVSKNNKAIYAEVGGLCTVGREKGNRRSHGFLWLIAPHNHFWDALGDVVILTVDDPSWAGKGFQRRAFMCTTLQLQPRQRSVLNIGPSTCKYAQRCALLLFTSRFSTQYAQCACAHNTRATTQPRASLSRPHVAACAQHWVPNRRSITHVCAQQGSSCGTARSSHAYVHSTSSQPEILNEGGCLTRGLMWFCR